MVSTPKSCFLYSELPLLQALPRFVVLVLTFWERCLQFVISPRGQLCI